jgi:hypothetical protein
MNPALMAASCLTIGALAACKPAGQAPELMKTQRESLNQAKGVEGQLQQAAEGAAKAIEDSQK